MAHLKRAHSEVYREDDAQHDAQHDAHHDAQHSNKLPRDGQTESPSISTGSEGLSVRPQEIPPPEANDLHVQVEEAPQEEQQSTQPIDYDSSSTQSVPGSELQGEVIPCSPDEDITCSQDEVIPCSPDENITCSQDEVIPCTQSSDEDQSTQPMD